MRVSRIEVFGFKSFMDRLVLPLEAGVTGIVGPNGCGKSNVVDALRWVLGETRATNLRGDVLEDIIFNGTDKLRPLGLAEVTVTLRSSGANFFSELVESLSLTKSPSQPSINGSGEPHESNEPSSEDSPEEDTPVSGGQNKRPELRVIHGALSAHPQGEKTGPESHTTPDDGEPIPVLTRFGWLESVNEVQITRRLYRSGESEFFINRVPCRLKDIKDLFRAAGLSARSHTIVAQGEVSRIVSAKPEERRMMLEEAAGVLGFRDKIAATKRRLEETAVNVSRLEDVIKEVQRQVNSLRVQASRAKSRETLKSQLASLEQTIFVNELRQFDAQNSERVAQHQTLRQNEAELNANLEKISALEHQVRNSLMSVDVENDAVRLKIDTFREDLRQRVSNRSASQMRLQSLKTLSASALEELERLKSDERVLVHRKDDCTQNIKELEAKQLELKANAAPHMQIQGIEGLEQKMEECKVELARQDKRCRELRDKLISHKTLADSLRAKLADSSIIDRLLASVSDPALKRQVEKGLRLLDCVRTGEKYALALQATLARKLEYVLVDRPHEFSAVNSEVIFGMLSPLAVIASNEINSNMPFPTLISCIEVDEHARGLCNMLLHSVYVAESGVEVRKFLDSGVTLAEGSTIVTLNGELFTNFSYERGAEYESLSHREKVKSLEQETVVLKQEYDQAFELFGDSQKLLQELEQQRSQTLRQSAELQARMQELGSAQGAVAGELTGLRKTLEQIATDVSRIISTKDDLEQKLKQYHAEEAALIESSTNLTISAEEEEIKEELARLEVRYAQFESERKSGHSKLSELALEVDDLRRRLDTARQAESEASLELQRIALGRDHIRERVSNEYGSELFDILAERAKTSEPLSDEQQSEISQEVSRLRARIHREGEVDSTSIQRFDEESERLSSLNAQKQDLESASDTLKQTIERLTEISEKRFLDTFHAVNNNFSTLMPRLFGGGKGGIYLIDSTKPLETGVEIIVRPPGKKLKSIELLSGGEKALCATALIFAMFMERPSPLCVLDEVDAPLDDANLVRFLTMVKEMSDRTQFVIITHNKHTMTMADNLVGVTMQQPGASKVISVSLQEAVAQVA